MKVSYLATFVIFVLGVLLGWFLPNINAIWSWIIMGLVTGMIPPNILKWFWWRFNGMGYAFGMGAGLLGALAQHLLMPAAPEYTVFIFVIALSTLGTIAGTFLGAPTGMDVLVNFYRVTKPFGFWGPVRDRCEPAFVDAVRSETHRDLLLLLPACLWQLTLFWMFTALVAKKWLSFASSASLVLILSFVLYRWWYLNLKGSRGE